MTLPLIVGFTGTRKGMTDAQKKTVTTLLDKYDPIEVHHGDCKGADEDFHNLYSDPQATCLHPCNLTDQRAFCNAAVITKPKDPLDRNRDIVNSVDEMIACPGGTKPVVRGSGTWYTIRYSKSQGIPVTIVYPDGSTQNYE